MSRPQALWPEQAKLLDSLPLMAADGFVPQVEVVCKRHGEAIASVRDYTHETGPSTDYVWPGVLAVSVLDRKSQENWDAQLAAFPDTPVMRSDFSEVRWALIQGSAAAAHRTVDGWCPGGHPFRLSVADLQAWLADARLQDQEVRRQVGQNARH